VNDPVKETRCQVAGTSMDMKKFELILREGRENVGRSKAVIGKRCLVHFDDEHGHASSAQQASRCLEYQRLCSFDVDLHKSAASVGCVLLQEIVNGNC